MVNRDFMCMIWFGFIKWRTTKDMMDGKYVIDWIYSKYYVDRHTDARDPRYIIMWSIDYRFGT